MACPGSNQLSVYLEENIRTLSELEQVRMHPGMYVGSTDSRGLQTLLFELVTNSIAEVVAGYGRSVRISLHMDGSVEVADDGRTLPSDTSVEHVFTTIGSGHHGYCPYPDGRDYINYTFANALSERLRVIVRGPGSQYQHTFRRGVTDSVLHSSGPPDDRGLTVVFRPDPDIFGNAQFDSVVIRNQLQQLAFLHSRVRIAFTDEVNGTHEEFEYVDGIAAYVRELNADRQPVHAEVILLRGEEKDVRYEIGLQWCADESELRMSFTNHYYTQHGGTHDNGVRLGVAAALRDYIREHTQQKVEFQSEDLRAGLTAVVSVWLREPFFESALRSRLGNPEVEGIVKTAVRRGVRDYLEANRNAANSIVNALILQQQLRVAASLARKQVRQSRNAK